VAGVVIGFRLPGPAFGPIFYQGPNRGVVRDSRPMASSLIGSFWAKQDVGMIIGMAVTIIGSNVLGFR